MQNKYQDQSALVILWKGEEYYTIRVDSFQSFALMLYHHNNEV